MTGIRWMTAVLAALVVLALPPAGAAKQAGAPVDKLAADSCAQERKDIGRQAFRKRYGERRSMRVCIRRSRGKVRSAVDEANETCAQEVALLGWSDFVDIYGTDETGADAFAECVADGVDETLDPSEEEVGDYEVDDEGP